MTDEVWHAFFVGMLFGAGIVVVFGIIAAWKARESDDAR